MQLREDYKDALYDGARRYRITPNADGTSVITDETAYTDEGDQFGANDINNTNKAVNALNHVIQVTLPASGWSAEAPYTQTVQVEGLTAEDNPLLVKIIQPDMTPEQVKAYNKAIGMIDDGDTGDGTATFKCFNKKPTIDITVGLKGV